MLTILVPIDYSENSDKALRYALELTGHGKVKVIVLHVGEVLMLTSTPQHLFQEIYEKRFSEKEEELAIHVKKITHHAGFEIKNLVLDFTDGYDFHAELEKSVEKHKPDLVIMGTKGATGLKKVLFGSNTVKAIENLKVPVLAVPELTREGKFKNLAYASDLKLPAKEVQKLQKIAKELSLSIEIFHVYPNYPEWIDPSEEHLNEILTELKSKFPELNLSVRPIKTDELNETIEGIKCYVNIFKPDVLAMFPTKRNLFEKIFVSSNTEDIAYESSVPLLSVPQD